MRALVFILGREPHLSVAELAAVLDRAADWKHAALSRAAAIVSVSDASDARALMTRLGGTVKIGELWREIPHDGFDGSADAIGACILERTTADRKVHFGFSVYDFGGGTARVRTVRDALRGGAAAQKAWLTEHDRKVRWVTSRDATLSSVVVAKNDLLPERNGVEVIALVGADRILLAHTLAVQPFEEWGERDYGRPGRDAHSGMLPPKLARMMVNIALPTISPIARAGGAERGPPTARNGMSTVGVRSDRTRERHRYSLLDPFCGSGTVLTEAMALGIPRIIGTDASADAVRDATANVAWVGERIGTRHEITITQCDVRQLAHRIREPVDAIVTEPFLGPTDARDLRDLDRVIAELHALYIAAFQQFARVLIPGGRAVFIVPEFRIRNRARAVDMSDEVAPLGFRRVHPFPEPIRTHPVFRDAGDLPYARPDQRVGRKVLIFARA